MSIRVMTLVWDRFPGSGSELLAMLALADWCSDEGDSLHPSIARVAIKIRASESQARRILHGLIAAGWLSVVGNANGGRPGTTRQYRLNIAKLVGSPRVEPAPAELDTTTGTDATPTGGTDATPRMDATPRTDARDGSHGCAETGVTHDTRSVSRSISDPLKDLVRPKAARQRREYTPEFESAWDAYPKRHAPPNKHNAFKAWNARLRAGHTAQEMRNGVDRYRVYVTVSGKVGTEFVLMPETFFGIACHFLTPWPTVPPQNNPTAAAPKSSLRATVERLQERAHADP